MIKMIQITNFKSLGDVTLELSPFNCLVGMNGAGKSSVLQAFDFIHHLMIGDIDDWLDARGWSVADLNNKLRKESNISLRIVFVCDAGTLLEWHAEFNRAQRRCTKEWVVEHLSNADEHEWKKTFVLDHKKSRYFIEAKGWFDLGFVYQGSLLSIIKPSELTENLKAFKDELLRIRSLELLSPQLLRKKARKSDKDIGIGGEKLSAYLSQIKDEEKKRLIHLLQSFYPNVVDFKVSSLASGWKKLTIIESFEEKELETEAMHMNDGLLRILAVLAQSHSKQSLLLLDEIENGINQEIIEPLVNALLESQQQVMVTTHNPLILNYVPDDIAKQAVQFIYKAPNGETKIKRFFDIPRIAKKLDIMGAGDAFVDTDLRLLTQECVDIDVKVKEANQA